MENKLIVVAELALKAADTAAKVDGGSSDKSPEVCRCISLLKQLKDFPVSYDILVSTQVDKRLRRLRIHNKEKVRLMAKWLLEIWSVIIKDGSSRNRRNTVTISVESTKARRDEPFRNKRKRDGEVRVEKPMREAKVCKRQEEQQQTIKCLDALRNKVREVILEGLKKVAGEVSEQDDEEIKEKVRSCDPVAVAVSVESTMFKKLGPFNGAEKLKYRSIMFNVKDPKNRDFRRKILVRELKPERVVSMTTEEMASDERQLETMLRHAKAMAKIQESVKVDQSVESVGKADQEALWLESLK